jgi:membrane fusion protein, multidrug efflux system
MKVRSLPYVFLTLMLSIISVNVQAQEGPPPVPVELVSAKVAPIDEIITTTGVLKAKSSVIITTEIPGRLVGINFKDGGKVQHNAVLFKLNDSLLQAELHQAQARLDNAKSQYERFEQLVKSGTGNTAQRDDALAQLRVEQAQLQYIKTKLAQTDIQAPFSGFVGLSKVEVGDYVAPGAKLVNLEAIDTLTVDFKIPEIYLKAVKPEQLLYLKLDGFMDEVFSGKVTAIDPALDARLHSLSVRGTLDNPDNKLRPGLFSKIELVINHRENALLVPESAIQFSENGPFLYKIEDSTAHVVKVKTGIRQTGWVEILEGISKDEQIVISGQNRLYEGAKTYPAQQ